MPIGGKTWSAQVAASTAQRKQEGCEGFKGCRIKRLVLLEADSLKKENQSLHLLNSHLPEHRALSVITI